MRASLLLASLLLAAPATAAPHDLWPVSRDASGAKAPGASPAAAHGRDDVAKARRFLRGRRFSTFRSTGTLDTPASIERHYDFCPGARVRYESTFLFTGDEDGPTVDVRTGRWRVTRARISAEGFGTARIRLVADTGEPGAVLIEASPRGFRLGGEIAEVTRSPVCEG